MISKLDLYILNSDNSVTPFPSEAEQIVLYDFAFEAQRMGAAPEITATIQADGSLEKHITTKVFCEYNGARYYLKNLPSSSKENTDSRYTFDLTFVSERTILDNVYMIDAVQGNSNVDRYQSNSTNIVFMGTIEELVGRLNAAMTYAGVGYSVVLDKGITTESKLVSFQDKFFTEALQEGVNVFNIPYYYVGKVIHFGWAQNTIPTLKYGDGLLSINRSIRTERIVNRATATGSSANIPYYYPNPTPKGFLTLENPNRLDAFLQSQLKLSKIPEGGYLQYKQPVVQVEKKFQYSDFSSPNNIQYITWNDGVFENNAILYHEYKDGVYSSLHLAVGVELNSYENDVPFQISCGVKFQQGESSDFVLQGCYIKQPNGDHQRIDYYKSEHFDGEGNLIWNIDIHSSSVSTGKWIIILNIFNIGKSRQEYPVYFNFYTPTTIEGGWYVVDSKGIISSTSVNARDYGISVISAPKHGDKLSYRVANKIPFATTLMPPMYRKESGEQRFYNAINGAYEGIRFENEYSKENPKEAIIKFEDIKPTIVGVTNANGERIDMFAEIAYDRNDSDETEQTDENTENFIHPYFYAKLRKTNDTNGGDKGFNLFAQAIESGEMTIEMTSGHCGACKFVIAVDENTQRNLVMVDDNGDLIYDDATGKVKMADDATGLERQNDTQNYEVWIALKKDISTFSTVMPIANSAISPSITDTFIITNIILPQAYITTAEKKLEDEIIAFLVKNNAFKFDHNINFSRIFLKKRNDVFSNLTENSIIPIEYNGNKLSFYVSSYTYRKQKSEVLPEISVSLTDAFDSTPSVFQQSISALQESVAKRISAVGLTLEDTDTRYLRKDVADIVKERTIFEKGLDFGVSLASKNFKKGALTGSGFGVYIDDNGDSVAEVDRMVIRQDAQFSEIVINQTTFQLGATVFSSGGCNITKVEEIEGAYRCYYDNKSGTRFSGFVVGDMARCQRFDENQKEVIKYYWRSVIAIGHNYVDLSTTDVDGVGKPNVGDDIVQFGNRTNPTRQSAIVIASTPTPTILQYVGINSFDLPDPVTKISPNDNKFTGKMVIEAGSEGAENLGEFGKFNLLLNSGFTGDYLSKQLQGDSEINGDSEMFSPSLVHWVQRNVYAHESSESASGAEVVFLNLGMIRQSIENNIVDGDSYVLSFKAKGSSLSWSAVGQNGEVTLTSKYERYSIRLQAGSNSKIVEFTSDNATICEVQLERGTIASVWGNSMWDNTSALARYQELEYMRSALKDGKTVMDGGLILSRMLALFEDAELQRMTAGVNGSYVSDDTPAFWAGGSLDAAIDTVQRFRDNPSNITDEEWSSLAKFVATHGGDVFMRGYIHALGGLFQGAVDIAGGKIKLNADGSGSLAAGGYSWDSSGVAKKTYPDAIKWVKFLDIVDENNQISLDKGGYIGEVWSGDYQAKKTFYLPSDVNAGFSICLKVSSSAFNLSSPIFFSFTLLYNIRPSLAILI